MTSKERHEGRYQRRKALRQYKLQQVQNLYDDFNKIFTYEHLYRSYLKCRRGVAWKASVQKYIIHAPTAIKQTYDLLH